MSAAYGVVGPTSEWCEIYTSQTSPNYAYADGTINDQTLDVLSSQVSLTGLSMYVGNDFPRYTSSWAGTVTITTAIPGAISPSASASPSTLPSALPSNLIKSPTSAPTTSKPSYVLVGERRLRA